MTLATLDRSASSTEDPDSAGLQDVVTALLREQQSLSAVESFSNWHETAPSRQSLYQSLLPTSPLEAGEQFAFEVDLDACSGCKACVTACHSLNGLDEEETWRSVGAVINDSLDLPIVQHVTTACHHCVDPGCLLGCPVLAYDKDPKTGIVRHLDDQCIGCQYCVLMCPYESPQYNAKRGIVRKCDMCRQRLEVDEAPACVQGCPNQAIRITKVSAAVAHERADTSLVPTAVTSKLTTPTTIYKSRRAVHGEEKWAAGDARRVSPAHAHWPLVFMLVLTQASVGLQCVWTWQTWMGQDASPRSLMTLATSVALGLLGGAAATLHLGSPWKAWKVFLGLRTSWLSREAIAFGVFGPASGMLLGAEILGAPQPVRIGLAILSLLSGVLGVVCSIQIYAVTGRPLWTTARVAIRFLLTTLGTSIAILMLFRILATGVLSGSGLALVGAGIVVAVASTIATLEPIHSLAPMLDRPRFLLRGVLFQSTMLQVSLNVAAGIVLPLACVALPKAAAALAGAIVVARWVAEIFERRLFFEAGVAIGMPRAQP